MKGGKNTARACLVYFMYDRKRCSTRETGSLREVWTRLPAALCPLWTRAPRTHIATTMQPLRIRFQSRASSQACVRLRHTWSDVLRLDPLYVQIESAARTHAHVRCDADRLARHTAVVDTMRSPLERMHTTHGLHVHMHVQCD